MIYLLSPKNVQYLLAQPWMKNPYKVYDHSEDKRKILKLKCLQSTPKKQGTYESYLIDWS